MYDIKFFELRITLILQLWSWCAKYICIRNTIFITQVHKKFTFPALVEAVFHTAAHFWAQENRYPKNKKQFLPR